jgi:hypothetical protein
MNDTFDLILRGDARLDRALLDTTQLPALVMRLLLTSVLGLAIHGFLIGLIANAVALAPVSALAWMPFSFVVAFIGAISICLPSFYFYTQLSGLDASFRLVTAQALRAQATTSVFLLAALPFYGAWALTPVLGYAHDPRKLVLFGMVLPFLLGLRGIHAVRRSFDELSRTLPITHRRRGDYVRRLVLAWGAVYSAVAPVALFLLADAFGLGRVL